MSNHTYSIDNGLPPGTAPALCHNRLATETDARGRVKTCSYEQARGLLLEISYSDDTPTESFAYNHLAQLVVVADSAGTRAIGYNEYAEQDTDSLLAGGKTHLVTETRDSLGRSTGYTYAKDGNTEQTVSTAYGTDGRISRAGFLHGSQEKLFAYGYLPGSHLLQTFTKPNGMTLTQTYEQHRDLLTQMDYNRGNTLVARRSYQYDTLGRPTSRTLARQGATRNDAFTYNDRSELIGDVVDGTWYTYGWDLTKNVWEVYGTTGYIGSAYTYSAYGQVTASGSITQPIQWSSEYNDTELGLVYYNYRHYNPIQSKWLMRDLPNGKALNLYDFTKNSPSRYIDSMGRFEINPFFINCIGHAMGLSFAIYPNEDSLSDILTKFGWNCEKTEKKDCECKCGDKHILYLEIHIVIENIRSYLRVSNQNDPRKLIMEHINIVFGDTKDIFHKKHFWRHIGDSVDFHGIKIECENRKTRKVTQIPCNMIKKALVDNMSSQIQEVHPGYASAFIPGIFVMERYCCRKRNQ
ncbi:MAG: RHS repeat-associated core domain-containing protein [Akkermansia sp.]|nr:RHS repeat-associated core domain-containing protein [Akkermansia sp.]